MRRWKGILSPVAYRLFLHLRGLKVESIDLEDLARLVRAKPNQVKNALRQLEGAGFLSIEEAAD